MSQQEGRPRGPDNSPVGVRRKSHVSTKLLPPPLVLRLTITYSQGGRLSLASDISRSSRSSIVLMNSILHDEHSFAGGGGGKTSLKIASCAMNKDGALVFAGSTEQQEMSRSGRTSLSGQLGGGQAINNIMDESADDENDNFYMDGGGDTFSDISVNNECPPGDETGPASNSNGSSEIVNVVSDNVHENGVDRDSSSTPPIQSVDASVHPVSSTSQHPLFNPLALLDPYEVEGSGASGASRPVKTDRRTFRVPPPVSARKEDGDGHRSKKRPLKHMITPFSSTTKAGVMSLFEFHMSLSQNSKEIPTTKTVDAALAASASVVCKPSNLLKVGATFQKVHGRRARLRQHYYAEQESSRDKDTLNNAYIKHRNYSDEVIGADEGGGYSYFRGGDNGDDDDDDNYYDMGGGGAFVDDEEMQGVDEDGGGFAFPRLSTGGLAVVDDEVETQFRGGGEEAQLARRVEAQLALSLGAGGRDEGEVGGGLSYSSGYTNTFENLCREHIASFMKGAEDYARETNLSRRVNAWTLRLEPILLEQEARPAFDIHEYSDKTLQLVSNKVHIHEPVDEDRQVLSSDDDEDGTDHQVKAPSTASSTVKFSEVVSGESSTEVCRIFLACLQLANLGNLSFVQTSENSTESTAYEISSKKLPSNSLCDVGSRDISDFSVHLIDNSSNRLDIDNYRAPSARAVPSSGMGNE